MIPSWDLLDRNNFLIFFWSFLVYFSEFNMALLKAASQSETLWNYDPNLAVDGDSNTCSFTPQSDVQRWWQVSDFFFSICGPPRNLWRSIYYMGICIRKPLRMSKHFIEKWLESGFRCRLSWTDQQSSPPQAILRWSLKVLNFLYFPRVPFYAFKTIYYYQRSF